MLRSVRVAAASIAVLALSAPEPAAATSDYRISGPFVHENLAIYLLHGAADKGAVPLTLAEALARGAVRVSETGNVNQLEIENLGGEEVFVQSGDIVKGGRQDRVLMVSLMLSPHSGRVPIGSFCVEQGRWSARGKEDAKTFSGSVASLPSREAKLAIKAPANAPTVGGAQVRSLGGSPQQKVWDSVSSIQSKLADSLGAPVASPRSRSSLQLALESQALKDVQQAYMSALQRAGENEDDVVGYVFAVNGKLNAADVYPSNGLFRKMWAKLLSANATEAIGERTAEAQTPPTVDAVRAFLAVAERGDKRETDLPESIRLETRSGDTALYFETRRADGGWVHRNYLAK